MNKEEGEKLDEDKLDLEKLNNFLNYLQGKYIPPYWEVKNDPKLSLNEAWNVIYMLQEWIGVIPDNFELCSVCKQIFDMDHYGFYAGDDEEQVKDNIEAGYNIDLTDVNKFFCNGCR